ncbi:cis-abienol synthase, chloroplastic isoform X1 [Coffea arabica]|uniref:Cis-abienol synthase, chloroplastic isoform X1 n=2 Tax=Coffea arabica TaxID=13443 RepID=A0A6P6TY80_COFAR|nr:cis-abienol synthase, chloroplastic-like isoform X1 [Coffea arabica]
MVMLLSPGVTFTSLREHKIRNFRHASGNGFPKRSMPRCCLDVSLKAEGSMAGVKEMFGRKINLSVSAYDTAWVAMVPSRDTPNVPCFPECLDWIVENQHQDGSWGLLPGHPLLVKDKLSCTIACVIALRKWRVGKQSVQRGLNFIGSHGWAATDTDQLCPIGFGILFPAMIKEAIELGLDVPLDPVLVDDIINQTSVIESFIGKEAILATVAEGVGESCFWEAVKNQKRSNGSLVNSPSTTAAALLYHHDEQSYEYLCSVLKEYSSGVPVAHPTELYARLCMVDALQRLGVQRYFRHEMESVLKDADRHWQLKSEEIFLDITCCALGFRLLRTHGYEVSSDELARLVDQHKFSQASGVQFMSLGSILELHRASCLMMHESEVALEQIHTWTTSYLTQQLSNEGILDETLSKEVEYALKNENGTLDRIQSRQSIHLYREDKFDILKTSYRYPNLYSKDLLTFSLYDFNYCQAHHKAELRQLERWYKGNRLDQLKDTRQVLHTAYFLITADVFNPELTEARAAYAENIILGTIVDDLFDNFAPREELLNIIDLVKKWDEPSAGDYYSNRVEIFYSALYKTLNEIGAKVVMQQGRCIKNHLVSAWLKMLEGMMSELDWWEDGVTPTIDEYLAAACETINARVCILPTIFLLGIKLPDDIIDGKEYSSLLQHVTIVARLLNDLQTYKKELIESKPNCIQQLLVKGNGVISEEEAITKMKEMIETSRRKLLQMVLQTKGSSIPRVCKDVFWTTSKIAHFLYSFRDEFSSPKEMINHINQVIYEPLILPRNIG